MPSDAPAKDCILVVDDTPDSLRLLVDTLEMEGMTALVATSGEAALDLLEQETPDLILMDAVLPGLDGFEATRRIKRNPAFANVPIIFMTGLTEPEHAVAALENGGIDYIRKPIVIEELLARLRVHLANARNAHRQRLALDGAGRHLVAVDADGRVVWCTPQAGRLLSRIAPDWNEHARQLPEKLLYPMQRIAQEKLLPGHAIRVGFPECDIDLAAVESERAGDTLIRLTEVREGAEIALLQRRIGLTQREAEVLLWLSYGKSNRSISEILGISPRTVNKHLQQIFIKLGVETRAAATAMAVRIISE